MQQGHRVKSKVMSHDLQAGQVFFKLPRSYFHLFT